MLRSHANQERMPEIQPLSHRNDADLAWVDDKSPMTHTETGLNPPQYDSEGRNRYPQQGVAPLPRPPPGGSYEHPVDSRHHVIRFWAWELVAVVVAVGIMAAMVSILGHFDGQELPNWPISINLNTLIALLSVLQRAALVLITAEVIGQAKWEWFIKPRPLSNLQDFEGAAGSVTGSFRLLFKAPSNMFALAAALITIISLAAGPFTQQAVKQETCPRSVTDVQASIPIAQFVPGSQQYFKLSDFIYEVNLDMKGAVLNGLADPQGNATKITATCQTGNCTFPETNGITYSSMGLCSRCIDTTSFVSFNKTSFNTTLPNGLTISSTTQGTYLNVMAMDNLTWATSAFTDDFKNGARAALTNVTVLEFTDAPCFNNSKGVKECPHNVTGLNILTDFLATSCTLYPCLKNYHGVVARGVLTEDLVSTIPAPTNQFENNTDYNLYNKNYTALLPTCTVDGKLYDLKTNISLIEKTPGRRFAGIEWEGVRYSVPDECLYKLWNGYGSGIARFLGNNLFNGKCTYTQQRTGGGQLFCAPGVAFAGTDLWWLGAFFNNAKATFSTISDTMDGMATSVTNQFRRTGGSPYDPALKTMRTGVVQETTVCNVFDWRWLLLPVFLVAATVALLFCMIVHNYRHKSQPVWKSNVLPFLFYGFRHNGQHGPRAVLDEHELTKRSERVKVRFVNGMDAGFEDITGATPHAQALDTMEVDSLYHK